MINTAINLIQAKILTASSINSAPTVASYPNQLVNKDLPGIFTTFAGGGVVAIADGSEKKVDGNFQCRTYVSTVKENVGPSFDLAGTVMFEVADIFTNKDNFLIRTGQGDPTILIETITPTVMSLDGLQVLKYSGIDYRGFIFNIKAVIIWHYPLIVCP